jgi:hypothetical protein
LINLWKIPALSAIISFPDCKWRSDISLSAANLKIFKKSSSDIKVGGFG